MLLIALFLSNNFYKANIYNTLGAIKNLQLYNSDNSRFASGGVFASFDAFCVYLSSVLRIKFSGKIPPERKAANRYKPFPNNPLLARVSLVTT
jgi:hypothetical protein